MKFCIALLLISTLNFGCGSPIDVGSIVDGIADAVRGKEYDSPPYAVVATYDEDNTPQPTNPRVYIVNRPPMTVFTRRVGGYMNNNDWKEESETLDTMIENKGFQVKSDEFYANGYNSPMQFWNRRNEVWKVKI